VVALRDLIGLLTASGRAAQTLPVQTARQWTAIRQRWQSPLAVGVRNVSRRLSWQVSVSAMVTVMALVSGVSLRTVSAAGPTIPSIQTPGMRAVLTSDTPTLTVTQAVAVSYTPTLTLTPIPNGTN
jgi:hypothetical protein